MSNLISKLYDLYIRLLVWLGAAPPEGYENLLPPEERRPSDYTLQEGETLYAVARRFGLHHEVIAKANNLEDAAEVGPGQTIIIPPADWEPETSPALAPPKEKEPEPAEETASADSLVDEIIQPDETETPPQETVEAPPVEETVADEKVADETIDEAEKIEAEEALPPPEEPAWLREADETTPLPVAEPPAPVEDATETLSPEAVESPPEIETEAETPPEEDEKEETFPSETEAVAEPPEPSASSLEAVDEAMLFRYEIQRGDTLNGIAKRYGVTVRDLIAVNEIDDPNRIYPGQKLIIPGYDQPAPPGEAEAAAEPSPRPRPQPDEVITHTIVRGDTLSSIAKRYDLTLHRLLEANEIDDPNRLRLGQRLIIPDVEPPSPPEPHPEPEPEPEPELPDFEIEPGPAVRHAPEPTVEIDPHFPPLGPLHATRGVYLSYFALGHTETRQHVFELLETTELNTAVIDVKGDHGLISYPTTNSTAQEIGAVRPPAEDVTEIVEHLRMRGLYTIARVVLFKDDILARNYPDLAVKMTANNSLWQDHEQSAWSDPFLKPVWDYNLQIAVEAARLGFDEIQFDYLRFPFASQVGEPRFAQDVSKENRVAAITTFLSIARGQLQPLGVKLSAKTFGYTCWRKDDSLIGQDIDRMGPYLDVLSPMLAPSTFGSGIPGYKFAIAHPYEVVHDSAKRAIDRVSRFDCAVRPWLQDFPDYRFDKRVYGRTEIQEQIRGCFDSQCEGFLVWSPQVQYTRQAYAPLKKAP